MYGILPVFVCYQFNLSSYSTKQTLILYSGTNHRIIYHDRKGIFNSIIHARVDILQQLSDLLNNLKIDYCIIGGLAVNAYTEPLVSKAQYSDSRG